MFLVVFTTLEILMRQYQWLINYTLHRMVLFHAINNDLLLLLDCVVYIASIHRKLV